MKKQHKLILNSVAFKNIFLVGCGLAVFLLMVFNIKENFVANQAVGNPPVNVATQPANVAVNLNQDNNFTVNFNISGQKVTAVELFFTYDPALVEYFKEYSSGSGFAEVKLPGADNYFDVPLIEEVTSPSATSKQLKLVLVSKFNDPANPAWTTNVTGSLKFRAKQPGTTAVILNKTLSTFAGLTSTGEATYFDPPTTDIQALITITGTTTITPTIPGVTVTMTPTLPVTATPTLVVTNTPTATPIVTSTVTPTITTTPAITPACVPEKTSGWEECRYGQSTYNLQACRARAAQYKGVTVPTFTTDVQWYQWAMGQPNPLSCGTSCSLAPTFCVTSVTPSISPPKTGTPSPTQKPGFTVCKDDDAKDREEAAEDAALGANSVSAMDTNSKRRKKFDLLFIPEGYKKVEDFEADVNEMIAEFKDMKLSKKVNRKINFITYLDLNKKNDIKQCDAANNKKGPCWNKKKAKKIMRECDADGYMIIVNVPKANENPTAAREALEYWGRKTGAIWSLGGGEGLILRYDLKAVRQALAQAIAGSLDPRTADKWEKALEKFME